MLDKSLRAALVACVVLACEDSVTDLTETDPEPPTISLTQEFGDPPLAGAILLMGPPDTGIWRYAVDVDDDGVSDAEGSLSSGDTKSLPYMFEDPGVHDIRIEFRRESRVERADRFVIVNDPDFTLDIRTFEVAGALSGFEGVAVSEELNRLYLGEALHRRVHMLSLEDFRVLEVAENHGPRNTLEGFAFDEIDQELYVLDKTGNLQIFDGHTLERTREFRAFADAQHFIALTPMSVLWVSTPSLTAWKDGIARTVLDGSLGVGHFDLYGEGEKILFSSYDGTTGRVGVADAVGNVAWREPLRAGVFPHVVAFSPDARFAFVMASVDHRSWRFLRFDAASGTVDYQMDLGPCAGPCWAGAANPIARTAGGRFLAVPTFAGAYFIDMEIGLPRFRTPAPGARFCCDVAALGDESLVFANGTSVTIDGAIPSAAE